MSETPFYYHQTYKNRAEALEKLIHAKNWPVSQGKFYPDCLKHALIQPNKSLQLADLLNYVESKLKVDPVTGRSLVEIDHGKELVDLELREKRAKVKKLEREEQKDSDTYKHIDTVNQREAALIRRILTELEYQAGKNSQALIATCKGDTSRQADITRALQEMVYSAFRPIYENGEIDITFEDDIE